MLPDRREASAVEGRHAEPVKRGAVKGGRVALVPLPAIARIVLRMIGHNSVAGHLRHDRRNSDRAAFGVAGHDRPARPFPARTGHADRKRAVYGTSVTVRVNTSGLRLLT